MIPIAGVSVCMERPDGVKLWVTFDSVTFDRVTFDSGTVLVVLTADQAQNLASDLISCAQKVRHAESTHGAT